MRIFAARIQKIRRGQRTGIRYPAQLTFAAVGRSRQELKRKVVRSP